MTKQLDAPASMVNNINHAISGYSLIAGNAEPVLELSGDEMEVEVDSEESFRTPLTSRLVCLR